VLPSQECKASSDHSEKRRVSVRMKLKRLYMKKPPIARGPNFELLRHFPK